MFEGLLHSKIKINTKKEYPCSQSKISLMIKERF